MIFFILAITTVSLCIWFYHLGRRTVSPLMLPILIVLPTFILRPLMIATRLDTPFPAELYNYPLSGTMSLVNFAFIIWCFAYAVGIAFGRPIALVAGKLLPRAPLRIHRFSYLLMAVAFTAVSVLLDVYFIRKYGSIGGLISAVKVSKELTGLYFLKYFPFFGGLLSIVGMCSVEWTRRWATTVGVFAAMLLLNCFIIFTFGERITIGQLAVSAWVATITMNRLSIKQASFITGSVIVCLFMLSGIRYAMVRGDDERDFTFLSELSASLHLAEYDACVLLMQDFGDRPGVREGEDFYNGVTGLVPRMIWPNRPTGLDPGQAFRQIYQPNIKNGWPFTMIGEWFANFGWIGILLGGLASGVGAAAIYYRYLPVVEMSPWAATVGPFLALKVLYGGIRVVSMQQCLYLVISFAIIAIGFAILERSLYRRQLGIDYKHRPDMLET